MKTLPLLILCVGVAGCITSTGPSERPVSVIQIPGCVGSPPGGESDTCFDYQFGETLVFRFCASANCCPDSSRFAVKHRISSDTIYVTVSDTAAHLCRCFCSYRLVMAFEELEYDSYSIICTREDYSSQLVIYSKRVRRG